MVVIPHLKVEPSSKPQHFIRGGNNLNRQIGPLTEFSTAQTKKGALPVAQKDAYMGVHVFISHEMLAVDNSKYERKPQFLLLPFNIHNAH